MSKYETVIGLEVHIQLNTASKMFCGCSNLPDDEKPNSVVCPVCFGMPGTLPVANKEAIRKTFLFGVALGARINDQWNFERKNYFYPDLPKGYQITSSTNPPIIGGSVKLFGLNDQSLIVRINHVHLEEDAGKLIHGNSGYSMVDLNRAGTPLMEMVTEPDIPTPRAAKQFLQTVRTLVRSLGISYGDMEKGHFRCDANISLRLQGKPLGKKVEIKNLNSFSAVERALIFEQDRQEKLLNSNKEVVQETRGWDENKGVTLPQRTKEDAQDYRYMPEPDIPPIVRREVAEFSDAFLQQAMPELPEEKRNRLITQYHFTPAQAEQCVVDVSFGNFVNAVFKILPNDAKIDYPAITNRILFGDVARLASQHNLSFDDIKIKPQDLVKIVESLASNRLSNQNLKVSLVDLLTGQISTDELLKKSTSGEEIDLPQIIASVIAQNQPVVKQYHAGDTKVLGFLIGQVMKQTKGLADPQQIDQLLLETLKVR